MAGTIDAANAVLAGRVILDKIILYIPHYTPNTSNQKILSGHIVSRAATELSYFKRSSYIKKETTKYN